MPQNWDQFDFPKKNHWFLPTQLHGATNLGSFLFPKIIPAFQLSSNAVQMWDQCEFPKSLLPSQLSYKVLQKSRIILNSQNNFCFSTPQQDAEKSGINNVNPRTGAIQAFVVVCTSVKGLIRPSIIPICRAFRIGLAKSICSSHISTYFQSSQARPS